MSNSVITMHEVTWKIGEHLLLEQVSFSLKPGELLVVSGVSGSGKSSLVNIAAGYRQENVEGTVRVNGFDIGTASLTQMAKLWTTNVAVVFQRDHFTEEQSAVHNVIVSKKIPHRAKMTTEAKALLTELGLEDQIYSPLSVLSGGQRRRVSVARGLLSNPAALLADEPTANLDSDSAELVRQSIEKYVNNGGAALICAHSPEEWVEPATRQISPKRFRKLVDGKLYAEDTQ